MENKYLQKIQFILPKHNISKLPKVVLSNEINFKNLPL